MSAQNGGRKPKQPHEVARLEWVVGALGAIVTVGVLGVLGHDALNGDDGPPILLARVVSVTPTDGGFVVSVETENQGPSTAAEVVLRATLRQGEQVIEQAEAKLDYVARESRREAGVIFQRDPDEGTLEVAATSYRKP